MVAAAETKAIHIRAIYARADRLGLLAVSTAQRRDVLAKTWGEWRVSKWCLA
jgi:hypothetical protein